MYLAEIHGFRSTGPIWSYKADPISFELDNSKKYDVALYQ